MRACCVCWLPPWSCGLRLPRRAPLAWPVLRVYWASDPVGPGQSVMVIGDGLGDDPKVGIARCFDDAADDPVPSKPIWVSAVTDTKVEALQPTDTSLKFVVPATFQPGVFAYYIATPNGAVYGKLNRPTIWWTQGNRGTATSPGKALHLYGKNLVASDAKGASMATVFLKGPRTVTLAAQGDAYEATVALPADLPAGDYEVYIHNGYGGNTSWSEPVIARVEKSRGPGRKPYSTSKISAPRGRASRTTTRQSTRPWRRPRKMAVAWSSFPAADT